MDDISTKETEPCALNTEPCALSTEPNEKQDFSGLFEEEKEKSPLRPADNIENVSPLKPYHVVHSKEVREILRLRVEVELLKVSEETLKNELNVNKFFAWMSNYIDLC